MRSYVTLLAVVLSLLLTVSTRAAMTGKYSDGQLTVDLTESSGNCTGTLAMGNNQFPATAQSNGNNLDGSFKAGANSFPFNATLDGDTLNLTTGGKTYTLKRISPAANPPVANPLAAENPLAQAAPAAGGDPLAGYTVVLSTDSGKSLTTQKPTATSVQTAFEATLPDLTRYFGVKPKIGRAYQSVTDHNSGRATFTATYNGQPVQGFISCQVGPSGAAIAVIYCQTNAPPTEWIKLNTSPASAAAAPVVVSGAQTIVENAALPVPPAAASLGANSQVYQFPDGTGSLTLADGWKTQAQSALDPATIQGPADQSIWMNSAVSVQEPDSPMMKMTASNQARMKQMGMNPPPPPFVLVAKFSDPVQAMLDVQPQLYAYNASHGGASAHLDKILSHLDQPCQIPNGKRALIQWLVTRTVNGTATQYHGVQIVIIAQVGGGVTGGSWMYTTTGYNAPIATWNHDQPIEQAMIASLKINQQAFQQRSQERSQQQMAMIKQQGADSAAQLQASHDQFMQDQNTRFAIGQAQHQAQEDSYAQHNAQFNQDELAKARNKDNVVESIQGTRTVYDTQTGQSAKVDLMTAGATVDQMNQEALDPNRFVQIPLRDEQDPVPAR